MKIVIGITTYNRKAYLLKFKESLYASRNIDKCKIRVYDDHSTEYDIDFLRKIFPGAESIVRNIKNMGSDKNISLMYEDFLKASDDLLINADSDLIFHPDWFNFVKENFKYTDGVLSLYNSSEHPAIHTIEIKNNLVCVKEHIGSAGTVFEKKIIDRIVRNIKPGKSFDWRWSKYLNKNGIRLLVSNQSYIQHIGIDGQNCDMFFLTDFGLNFIPGSSLNAKFLSEYIQAIMAKNQALSKNREQALGDTCKATIEYKLGNFLLSPLISAKRKIISLFLK